MISNSSGEGSLPVRFYQEMKIGGADFLADLGIEANQSTLKKISQLDFSGQFSPHDQDGCDAECLKQMSEDAQATSEAAQDMRSDAEIILAAIFDWLGYGDPENTAVTTPGIDIPTIILPTDGIGDVRGMTDDAMEFGQEVRDGYNKVDRLTQGTTLILAPLIILALLLAVYTIRHSGTGGIKSRADQAAHRVGKQR